jgi:hypothetical protein
MTLWFGTAADGRTANLGASGAIAAVLGAYFVLYPGSKVTTWIFPSSYSGPGVDLPRAVVPSISSLRRTSGCSRPRRMAAASPSRPNRRIHFRPARHRAPHPDETGRTQGAVAPQHVSFRPHVRWAPGKVGSPRPTTCGHGRGCERIRAASRTAPPRRKKPGAGGRDAHLPHVIYDQTCYQISELRSMHGIEAGQGSASPGCGLAIARKRGR